MAYSLRCLPELIRHIDRLDHNPNEAEIKEIVYKFREVERSHYETARIGNSAAMMVTAGEIKSIIRTKRFRIQRGGKEWQRATKGLSPSQRRSPGVITVGKGILSIDMGKANMEEWNLYRFASVDVFTACDNAKELLLCFQEDNKGEYELGFRHRAPPYVVRCGGTLKGMGVKYGHYRIRLLDSKYTEFVIDFSRKCD